MRLNKGFIIATALSIGTLAVGGTVYAVVQNQNHKELINNAQQQINQEQKNLDELTSEVNQVEIGDGYLASEITASQIIGIQNSLNSIKDSYTDYDIEKDDLKSEIKVIKVDVKSIKQKVKVLKSKLSIQNEVNALFEAPVIVGNQVTSQAIKAETVSSTIAKLKTTHADTLKESNSWVDSLILTLVEADNQLKQIETANVEVSKLVENGVVTTGVSRDGYNKAKVQVDKIKNETIKSELLKQLDLVMTTVKKNEADAKAKAERNTQSNSGQSKNISSYKSSNSKSKQSSSNRSTISSSNKQSSNVSSSNSSSNKKSSNANKPSSSSKPSSHNNSTVVIEKSQAKKTGEGKIKGGDRTYTEHTVEGVDTSMFK